MLMKIKQNNKKWPYIPYHPYRILININNDPRDLEKQIHYQI